MGDLKLQMMSLRFRGFPFRHRATPHELSFSTCLMALFLTPPIGFHVIVINSGRFISVSSVLHVHAGVVSFFLPEFSGLYRLHGLLKTPGSSDRYRAATDTTSADFCPITPAITDQSAPSSKAGRMRGRSPRIRCGNLPRPNAPSTCRAE